MTCINAPSTLIAQKKVHWKAIAVPFMWQWLCWGRPISSSFWLPACCWLLDSWPVTTCEGLVMSHWHLPPISPN
jgi:hypothetical protein